MTNSITNNRSALSYFFHPDRVWPELSLQLIILIFAGGLLSNTTIGIMCWLHGACQKKSIEIQRMLNNYLYGVNKMFSYLIYAQKLWLCYFSMSRKTMISYFICAAKAQTGYLRKKSNVDKIIEVTLYVRQNQYQVTLLLMSIKL